MTIVVKKKPNWCYYYSEKRQLLEDTMNKVYPFIGKISIYHPIIDLYTRSKVNDKRLNHKYLAIEMGETVFKINDSARIAKMKIEINKEHNILQWRKVFIKEIPLVPLKHTGLLERAKTAPTRCRMSNFLIFSNLFSLENSAYVEQLASFLCSNLVENNHTIHFPYYYGSCGGIFKTFSYMETTSSSVDNDNNTKTLPRGYQITRHRNKLKVKIPKVPVHLLMLENVEICLGDIIDNKDYCRNEWMSYIFQILAALSIVQSRYNLIHNDLHVGNVMCKSTKRKYLYYKTSDNTYFKVPTYGRIIKIVDWGRALLDLPSRKIWNNCFNIDFDVFGQYYPPNENQSSRNVVEPNTSFDMTIFTYSLLDPEYNLPNDDLIKFLINLCQLSNGENIYKTYKELTFNLYCNISKYAKHAIPKDLIRDPIFNEIKITKDEVENIENIYYLE